MTSVLLQNSWRPIETCGIFIFSREFVGYKLTLFVPHAMSMILQEQKTLHVSTARLVGYSTTLSCWICRISLLSRGRRMGRNIIVVSLHLKRCAHHVWIFLTYLKTAKMSSLWMAQLSEIHKQARIKLVMQ